MMVSAGENVVGRTSNRMSTPRIRKAPRPNMRPRLKSPSPRIGSIASRSMIESLAQFASVRATWGLDRNRSSRTRALCGTPARWALRHHVSQKRDTPIAYEDQPCGASRGPFSRMLASVIGNKASATHAEFPAACLLRPLDFELCFALARPVLFDDPGFLLVFSPASARQ